jgi:hypothetical protein
MLAHQRWGGRRHAELHAVLHFVSVVFTNAAGKALFLVFLVVEAERKHFVERNQRARLFKGKRR